MTSSSTSGQNFHGSAAKIPHLGTGEGVLGEIGKVRSDVLAALQNTPAIVVEEFTNLESDAAAGVNAAVTPSTSAVTTVTSFLLGTALAPLSAPRKLVITTAGATPADAPATVVITGKDEYGNVVTETLVPATTAASVISTYFYSQFTSLVIAQVTTADSTLAFGLSKETKLRRTPVSRAGLATPIREIYNGGLVTTGTLSVTNQSYTPATDQDGAHNYAVYYEAVPLI